MKCQDCTNTATHGVYCYPHHAAHNTPRVGSQSVADQRINEVERFADYLTDHKRC